MNQYKHLIFFDSGCSMCQRSVQKIIALDKQKIFCFSPLNGVTANDFLKGDKKHLRDCNSLVLVENFSQESKKFWIRSKGVFRILWLIGGRWKALGLLYILPAFVCDWAYTFIARHRHVFFKEKDPAKFITSEKQRFLP